MSFDDPWRRFALRDHPSFFEKMVEGMVERGYTRDFASAAFTR